MRENTQELKAEDLGTRIRAVRELAGAQQRDVAKAAGMSRRDLQSVERGAKRLEPDGLRAVAEALGVDPDVFLGVGFEGELARSPIDERIDRVVGHDPDPRANFPAPAGTAPPALPVNVPHAERRKDFVTRQWIEDSWRGVRGDMGDMLTSCARLVSAGAGDDVRHLIERLERDLTELKAKYAFQRNLIDHERALQQARSKHSHAPSRSVVVGASSALR